jgi:hypothetical protein
MRIKPFNSVQNAIMKHVTQNAIPGHALQNADISQDRFKP